MISLGIGAVILIFSLVVGWVNSMLYANKSIPLSLLLLLAPYLRSPLIIHPIFDNWTLIWWCRPVSGEISNKKYFFNWFINL